MEVLYDLILGSIKANLFAVFIVSFVLFYIIVIKKNIAQSFFLFFLSIITVFYWIQNLINISIKTNDKDTFIKLCETEIKEISEIDNAHIYRIHKIPKSLKYIRLNNDILNVIYKLRPMRVYSRGEYFTLITYIEYFLKYHYHIMTGTTTYNPLQFIPILKDLRKQILNISKNFIFNSPNFSPIFLLTPNLKAILDDSHKALKSITFMYLQIVKHKYDKVNGYTFGLPEEYEQNPSLVY